MNLDFENVVVPAILSAISGLFGWFVGRKKENIEIQGSEITNVQEAIKIWREMATEMKAEVEDLKHKIEALTTEVHTLRAENLELRQNLDNSKKSSHENNKDRRKGASVNKAV